MAKLSPLFAGTCAIAVALVAAPSASAQPRGGDEVFVDLGRWTIYHRPAERRCFLRLNSQGGAELTYMMADTGSAMLTLQTQRRAGGDSGEITWTFDEDEFDGRMLAPGVYTPVTTGQRIENAFRQSRYVGVRHGGASIAYVSLETSSAGFRLLEQCAGQWRPGFAALGSRQVARAAPPPAPPPPPSVSPPPPVTRPAPSETALARRSAPAREQAREQARPVTGPVPRNPAQWIDGNAFSRFPTRTWVGGVLEYTLVVNRSGRVDECVVESSSGSRDFDATACRELQRRARFVPAKNARGDAVSGRYSSAIRFQVPD